MELGEGIVLPFNWTVSTDSANSVAITIVNGEEAIVVKEVYARGDSFHARMPLFDSEFHGTLAGDSILTGTWVNHLKGDDYRIPFVAHAGRKPRFAESCAQGNKSFSGTWETRFSPSTSDAQNAIGMFEHEPNGRVTGTFLTEVGDYRYLEGAACGDSMLLSAFDGSHAFLFMSAMVGDSLVGRFWSGIHWQEPWVAHRNPGYLLRNPDSLTALREGYTEVDFRFKDTEGREHSPGDPEYAGKPLIVHIMGSWCPNCVDETALLKEMHDRYHDRGLNVLAVAFEKHADEQRALRGLLRFKQALGVGYPILYGGPAAKDQAAARLPFLNHLMSYPTCIFIDRKGKVRRIRTGFSGPGTGKHYTEYRKHFEEYLRQLLSEQP